MGAGYSFGDIYSGLYYKNDSVLPRYCTDELQLFKPFRRIFLK